MLNDSRRAIPITIPGTRIGAIRNDSTAVRPRKFPPTTATADAKAIGTAISVQAVASQTLVRSELRNEVVSRALKYQRSDHVSMGKDATDPPLSEIRSTTIKGANINT
jgi:hypothetical protein